MRARHAGAAECLVAITGHTRAHVFAGGHDVGNEFTRQDRRTTAAKGGERAGQGAFGMVHRAGG